MTTSIFSSKTKTLIADKRWSLSITLSDMNKYLVVCDRTDFSKLAFHDEFALLFSGNGRLIAEWKSWLLSGMKEDKPPVFYLEEGEDKPNIDNTVSLVSIDFLASESEPLVDDYGTNALFHPFLEDYEIVVVGTGTRHAVNCWQENKDLYKAIKSASAKDSRTCENYDIIQYDGVKTVTPTNDHCDHDLILEKMKGGMIMAIDTANTSAGFMCIADHHMRTEILSTLKTTSASAQSGSGHLWTPEQLERLDKSINEAKARRAHRNAQLEGYAS